MASQFPAAANNQDQARLAQLRQEDPDIERIVEWSKFSVAYLLQQDGPNPGWRKANIEGPVFVLKRRGNPRFQVLVKNQFSSNDLQENVHVDWELDCQKNYVFFKVEDPSKQIRGLWFHDDAERQRIERALSQALEELKTQPAVNEPQSEPLPQHFVPGNRAAAPAADRVAPAKAAAAAPVPAPQSRQAAPAQTADSVTVSSTSLRAALHGLASNDDFLGQIMQKLKEAQPGA